MGGVILFGLFVLALVALVGPALRARAKSRREGRRQAAHDDVVRRLEEHRPRLPEPGDEADSD